MSKLNFNLMQTTSFEEALQQILAKEPRFHRDAYLFLRDALDFTRKMLEREAKTDKSKRGTVPHPDKHVTPQQLLAGIRELALETFGPMTMTVFEEWGVRACHDFGDMVFILVDNQLLKKTDKDSRADFEKGYDFYEAFRKPFLPSNRLAATVSEPKTTSK